MGKKIQLVDLAQLRSAIAALKIEEPQREFLIARWLKYVEWWDSRASLAKSKYHGLRAAVVVGSALTPAIVGLRELQPDEYGVLFSVASVIVALIIAVCGGLEALFNYGDIWRHKRDAAEILKSEGFLYFELADRYRDKTHASAFVDFAERVEQLIQQEIEAYIAVNKPEPDKK
jgi:Protein of unknown function (DUF4231)